MNTKRLLIMLALVIGTLYASDAHAQACTISATSVNFGTYNVFNGSDVDSTGTVTYRCNGSAHNITVGLTQGASATFSTRQMQKGSEGLSYNLFLDASRTTIWGDGTSGTSVYQIGNPPNNTNVNLTVYGRVSAGQDVSAGTFSDTVTAVINF
jgi:spore coat protein U-like protein